MRKRKVDCVSMLQIVSIPRIGSSTVFEFDRIGWLAKEMAARFSGDWSWDLQNFKINGDAVSVDWL